MNVLVVSIFSKEVTYGKGRVGNLMKCLPADTKYTMLASDFDHRNKKYYDLESDTVVSVNGVVNHYIHVLSYEKNLSFARIWGNLMFGWGVRKFLKNATEEFDLIYCIVPSASGVLGCKQYLKKHKAKLVVDVMDLLPESLLPIIGDNIITRLALWPWFRISRKAYKTADFITGESKEYAEIAHQCNISVPYTFTYLGIDMPKINEIIKGRTKALPVDNTIKICYGGNLGNSYDFDAIFNALISLKEHGVNYTMYFIGGGDKEESVKKQITETGVNATVTGIVSYQEYIELMSQCDIGLNVFKNGTKIVHSYKFNDYAVCGLFIVSNLHGETEDMIAHYDCGITSDDISKILTDVCTTWGSTYKSKKANSLTMAYAELNADVIYKKQTDKILALLNE